MPVTLDHTKRMAIAIQLAEMKALQNLLIHNDQLLIQAIQDNDITQRLQEMLAQDQKNLNILETIVIQYGIHSNPKETTAQILTDIQNRMESSELTLSEKVLQHELLKHQQVMIGLVIHKAAQLVGADIATTIAPIHTINFENRAHQEQLKGMLEILGVRELTGQEANQGVWGRSEDAIAALGGIAGSLVTHMDDEMSLRDLLLMDHSKTDILFGEILASNDPQKIQEFFGQLYQDVKVHGLAEEQVLYPAIHPYYNQMQEIIDQTDHVIEMLNKIRSIETIDSHYKAEIEQLRLVVRDHINQEENDIFPKIKKNFSHEQQKQLATEFKAAKRMLQRNLQGQI